MTESGNSWPLCIIKIFGHNCYFVQNLSKLAIPNTLDKYLYLSPLLWSKNTLIASCVVAKGANHSSCKMRTIFLMSLALTVPIFKKKFHRTRAVEFFKLWPNFESFHSSCLMRFIVENWPTISKGHKKKILYSSFLWPKIVTIDIYLKFT